MSSENTEINILKVKLEAQKKDKTIYFLAGLLIGLIVSFLVTNRINSNAQLTAQASSGSGVAQLPDPSGQMPPNDDIHKGVQSGSNSGGPQPQVQAAIQKAKDNPNDYNAQVVAAGMYYQIGQNDKALEYLEKAYKLKPDNMEYEPLVAYAQLSLQADKNDQAVALFEKVIKQKPTEAEGYSGLGTAYRKLGQNDKAIAQFQKALSYNAKDVESLHEMTHAYLEKGDAKNAEATINKLKEIDPKNENVASLQQELDQLKLTGKIPSH